MKYVLVDNDDNVVSTKDLSDEMSLDEARNYFVGIKQIPYENFIQLWEVMTEDKYAVRQAKKPIEWWIEDKEITDSELKF